MERELFLTPANERIVERGVRAIAEEFGLDEAETRRLILEKISPHPPRAQCKEAIEKVRRDVRRTLEEKSG